MDSCSCLGFLGSGPKFHSPLNPSNELSVLKRNSELYFPVSWLRRVNKQACGGPDFDAREAWVDHNASDSWDVGEGRWRKSAVRVVGGGRWSVACSNDGFGLVASGSPAGESEDSKSSANAGLDGGSGL